VENIVKKCIISLSLIVIVTSTIVPILLSQDTKCQNCTNIDDSNTLIKSKWDNISFILINDSLRTVSDFSGKTLLLEFSSSTCPDCINQLPALRDFYDLMIDNDSFVLLTLFLDLSSQSELLDYSIFNNISWFVGSINSANYSSLDLFSIPSFHLFNSTSHEIKTAQHSMSFGSLVDFVGYTLPPYFNLGGKIYHEHKSTLPTYSPFSSDFLFRIFTSNTYSLGDTRNFYCLSTGTTYRTLSAQVVNITDHAYFFTESAIITSLGLGNVVERISSDVERFDSDIYSIETTVFGSVEGSFGNIGDGKVIVLYAVLPTGWAGYFDPYNEYPQEVLDGYFSNEWEMVYLDYIDSFETTLAHEFQHLIHFNHDPHESIWFDEGCSELAGFLTHSIPEEWENITSFVLQFSFSYDDSLIFWNYFSDGGRDVRIDYGGAYLFLLYFYEQFNTSALSLLVQDTQTAVISLTAFLASYNMTFNEFFLNWQTALIVHEFTCKEYVLESTFLRLNSLKTLSTEKVEQISVPYYGSYGITINLVEQFEITISNPYSSHLGVVILTYSNTTLVNIDHLEICNQSLTLNTPEVCSHIQIIFSKLDVNHPSISSGLGLGPSATLYVSTINPFKLSINQPIINQNSTSLTISALSIYFINGTDIFFSSAEDCVKIRVYSEKVECDYFLEFNPSLFRGWGIIINLSDYSPGTYNLELIVNSSSFYNISQYLTSFDISLDLELSFPNFGYDSSNSSIQISIDIYSSFTNRVLISELLVIAYVFSIDKKFYNSFQLFSQDYFTWNISLSLESFEKNYYYVVIFATFETQEFHSLPSDLLFIDLLPTSQSNFTVIPLFPFFIIFTVRFIIERRYRSKIV